MEDKGKKFRGIATLYEDGKVDFRPQQEGPPQQRGISSTRNGKLYETTGKQPKVVAHLTIDGKTVDRRAALYDELDKLLPDDGQQARRPRGRKLMDDADCRITFDGKQRTLQIQMDVDMQKVVDLDTHIFKLLTRITTCLAFNRTFLKQRSRA